MEFKVRSKRFSVHPTKVGTTNLWNLKFVVNALAFIPLKWELQTIKLVGALT
jgi:hypothetical protein